MKDTNGRYNQSYAAGYARAIEDAAKIMNTYLQAFREERDRHADDVDIVIYDQFIKTLTGIAAAIRALKLESGGATPSPTLSHEDDR